MHHEGNIINPSKAGSIAHFLGNVLSLVRALELLVVCPGEDFDSSIWCCCKDIFVEKKESKIRKIERTAQGHKETVMGP